MLKKNIGKKLALLTLIVAAITSAQAQIVIPKANFQFDFPDNHWKYLETLEIDNTTNIYLYSGTPTITKNNDTILPFMRLYVKTDIGKKNALDFAMERFMQQPFIIVDEFNESPLLPTKSSLGYTGIYRDKDGQRNKFYMIYFTNKGSLTELRLESSEDTFENKRAEFETILKSIKLN